MKTGSELNLPRKWGRAMKKACHPITTPRLAAARRWVGELSYRLATNRYVFYGAFILLASLIAGAVTRGHEVLWRSAAALGIATVVIGLLHAWLDARSARRNRGAHTKSRVKVR